MVQREVADRFFASPRRRRTAPSRCSSSSPRGGPASTPFRRPCSARGRASTRRSSRSSARRPRSIADVRPVVEAAFAHRRKTLANSLALAGRAPREPRRRQRSPRSVADDGVARRSSRRPSSSPLAELLRMTHAQAFAKINLGLVVGAAARGRQARGRHRRSSASTSTTTSRSSAASRARRRGLRGGHDRRDERWRRSRRQPVSSHVGASGSRSGSRSRPASGGGSSDAAAALRLANAAAAEPARPSALHRVAAAVGCRRARSSCATARSSRPATARTLAPVALPADYQVVLVVPRRRDEEVDRLPSTRRFDERDGAAGFAERRAALLAALAPVESARDLAALPPNDLASSPLAQELIERGRLPRRRHRAPARPSTACSSEPTMPARLPRRSRDAGRTWLTRPVEAGRVAAGGKMSVPRQWGVAKW